jgi:hypothetical protein
MTDEKFFDPNADPDRPFGGRTGQASQTADQPSGGPPRLALVNPDDYSSNNSNDDTYTATVTPTSAVLLSAKSTNGREVESPYEDQGNPFRNSIPASVPSFDFVMSPGPRNPARQQTADTATTTYNQVTSPSTGRALLPSQQARYVNNTQPEPPRNRQASDTSYEAADLPEEALFYASAYGRNLSSGEHDKGGDKGDQPSVDLSSVSGSIAVRRRYDGSAYDEYEY